MDNDEFGLCVTKTDDGWYWFISSPTKHGAAYNEGGTNKHLLFAVLAAMMAYYRGMDY